MKSWISFFLPQDEYKEKKMLYILSEGAVILFLAVLAVIIGSTYFNLDGGIMLLLAFAVSIFYVLGRYIVSGIEYTDISTAKEYKKEKRVLINRTVMFVVLFMIFYMVSSNVPSDFSEWIGMAAFLFSVGTAWFLINFISLKQSYRKNKELL